MLTSDSPVCSRLTDLPAGSQAQVHELRVGRDAASFLCALGLRPSCHVRVCVNRGMCIVQVGLTRIGLSQEIGRGIVVMKEGPGRA